MYFNNIFSGIINICLVWKLYNTTIKKKKKKLIIAEKEVMNNDIIEDK